MKPVVFQGLLWMHHLYVPLTRWEMKGWEMKIPCWNTMECGGWNHMGHGIMCIYVDILVCTYILVA